MKETFDYLAGLEHNNNRDWFHAHKAEKQVSQKQFEMLVQELIFRVAEFEPDVMFKTPKELIYRLPRDIRMYPGKPPYNPSWRAHISKGGRLPIPVGYFLMIQPGDRSCLCSGMYMSGLRQATLMVREYIFYHGDEWLDIINDEDFAKHFELLGDKLKNVPREYDKEHYLGEYLKNKSWYLEFPVTDKQVLSDDFPEYASGIFRKMQRFNHFLNGALQDFKYPEEM